MQVVVCTVSNDCPPWQLPASEFGNRPRASGGERTLYELATALAVSGVRVELRGDLVEWMFTAITDAAGAAPTVGMPARPPGPDDIVVLPEGGIGVGLYATVAQSEARGVMMLLAPPGQYGWDFVSCPPVFGATDVTTLSIDAVGRAEHYRAMHDVGFDLWSNSPGIARAANAVGVPCRFLGTGNPEGFPDLVERSHDLALVVDNKWSTLARRVVEELPGLSCLEISDQGHRTLASELGRARILVWPSRIEGDSRIQREARAMGTVPVALASNVNAAGLDDDGGAVVVDDLADMPQAICGLLDDPLELESLSSRAVETSRAWADWSRYVARVRIAVHDLEPARALHESLAAMGSVHYAHVQDLEDRIRGLEDRICRLEAHLDAFRQRKIVRLVDERIAPLTRRKPGSRSSS